MTLSFTSGEWHTRSRDFPSDWPLGRASGFYFSIFRAFTPIYNSLILKFAIVSYLWPVKALIRHLRHVSRQMVVSKSEAPSLLERVNFKRNP
jgi:hypothetical protein